MRNEKRMRQYTISNVVGSSYFFFLVLASAASGVLIAMKGRTFSLFFSVRIPEGFCQMETEIFRKIYSS